MALYETKVEIPAALAGVADEILLEQGRENWSVLEDVIAKRAWVVGIGADEVAGRREWDELAPALAVGQVIAQGAPQVRALADQDWRDSYKAHFHAWQFSRLHWVPVWQRGQFKLPPGDAVLWLDPGLAFGTGNHETTRLCVERLVTVTEERGPVGRVVDAGCGSGILALSAALLGYREVLAFDNDPEAVRIAQENAAANGLQDRVRFATADLVSGLGGEHGRVDVLLANIQGDVLMRFARVLVSAIAPGGVLILSGILAQENAQVRTAFEAVARDWTVNARVMGEWSDIVLTR